MRKPAWIRKSGPFKCASLVNGYITIKPSWEQCGAVWEAGEGGGPGIFDRMALAEDFERWLNSGYTPEQIAAAHQRVAQHDANMAKLERRQRRKTKAV